MPATSCGQQRQDRTPLAAHLDAGAMEDTALFYATDGFGAAQKLLLDLLAVVDELAPAQSATDTAGGAPMTAPHSYIPDGPVEVAPLGGYCPPEVRQEAFAAVLGVSRRALTTAGSSRGWPNWTIPQQDRRVADMALPPCRGGTRLCCVRARRHRGQGHDGARGEEAAVEVCSSG